MEVLGGHDAGPIKISLLSKLTIVFAVTTASLLLNACGNDSLKWTEDVILADGRTVTLTRYQEFKGPHELGQPPSTSDYWLEFKNPDTNEVVRWESNRDIQPKALSISGSVPELLTSPNYGGVFRYKCPDPFYIAFRYVDGKWMRIPLTQLASKVVAPNLTSSGADARRALRSGRLHLTTDDQRRILPYEWRGKVIDLSEVTEQTLDQTCDRRFNYMLRDTGAK